MNLNQRLAKLEKQTSHMGTRFIVIIRQLVPQEYAEAYDQKANEYVANWKAKNPDKFHSIVTIPKWQELLRIEK